MLASSNHRTFHLELSFQYLYIEFTGVHLKLCCVFMTFYILVSFVVALCVEVSPHSTQRAAARETIYLFIIHSRVLNQSVIVERVTCRSNILRYWTGTYSTVANCGFFHGFSTIFRCFVNFKHTTNDMAE